MNTVELQGHLDIALKAMDEIHRAVTLTLDAGFDVEEKIDSSLVTTADLEGEKAFRKFIAKAYPDHGIIGEEFPPENSHSDYQWIVDPIDGTAEFARGLPTYGSIVALHYKNEPVVGVMDHPQLNIRAWAAKGLGAFKNKSKQTIQNDAKLNHQRLAVAAKENFQRLGDESKIFDQLTTKFPHVRVFHSCFSHTCALIDGVDVTVDWNVNLWDMAATKILIEEAGGKYQILKQREHPEKGTLYCTAFGKSPLVDEIAALVESAGEA